MMHTLRAIHILRHARGWGLLIFVRKCDMGWMVCFWSAMSHFARQLDI